MPLDHRPDPALRALRPSELAPLGGALVPTFGNYKLEAVSILWMSLDGSLSIWRKPMARQQSGVSAMSVDALKSEIKRRARALKTLSRKRARIAAKLANLDAQIEAAGGSPTSRRGRARNAAPLVPSLVKALGSKAMGVGELTEAVQRSGYRSNAANFRLIVNATLLKHRKVFKKIARGKYAAA